MINTNTSEDFSFPTTTIMSNPLSNFTISTSSSSPLSSSSLWRINSSRVFHHQEDRAETEEDDDHMEVRSMYEGDFPSHRREIKPVSFEGVELEMEERMDYLWEDFNEEGEKEGLSHEDVRRSKEVCILEGIKVSRRPNASSGMLVMGKLLKGLFSFKRKSTSTKVVSQRW